jgi:hypothetical protein
MNTEDRREVRDGGCERKSWAGNNATNPPRNLAHNLRAHACRYQSTIQNKPGEQAENTTRKQARIEFFDKERARVNEKKNAVRTRAF